MNDKITFPRLATLLADRSGRSKRFSEDFLREFFSLISERLEAGESVKIKGLGTFRLSRVEPRRSVDVTTGRPMEISGHSKVVFIPAKELAEAVNAPFEAFTAIEIDDDADLSQIFAKDEIELNEEEDDGEAPAPEGEPTVEEEAPEPETVPSVEEEEIPAPEAEPSEEEEAPAPKAEPSEEEEEEPAPEAEPSEEEEEEPAPEAEPSEEEEEEPAPEAEPSEEEEEAPAPEAVPSEEEEEEPAPEAEPSEEEVETESPRMKHWVKVLLLSLGAAMVALIATFAVWYAFTTNDFHSIFNRTTDTATGQSSNGVVTEQTATTDQPATLSEAVADTLSDTLPTTEESDVPTAPSDALVYDTISTTRYLTTMAKAHYGNYNLWPYIYEENKAILGHPDRIRPGTSVVIPKLSKFGVDPKNNDDIEKAKKMGVEIYARYGKKI